MAHFHITQRSERDITILDLDGDLGIGYSNILLGDALKRLTENRQIRIILNLSKVNHIDETGMGEIIRGYQNVTESGGQLKICALNTKALELMTIIKLFTVFEVFDSEKTATESFKIRRNYHISRHIYDSVSSRQRNSLKIF